MGRRIPLGSAALLLGSFPLAACGADAPVAADPVPSGVLGSAAAVSANPETRPPTRIAIPGIGVDSEVQPVGAVDRVLQIPPQPWVVGWWNEGVGLGEDQGTVVLVAHLDSREYGVGPFAKAKDLQVGSPMALGDGNSTQSYWVSSVDTYLKTELPYEQLFAQTGRSRVVLVTCGGEYHDDGSGWDSNVVVTFEQLRIATDGVGTASG